MMLSVARAHGARARMRTPPCVCCVCASAGCQQLELAVVGRLASQLSRGHEGVRVHGIHESHAAGGAAALARCGCSGARRNRPQSFRQGRGPAGRHRQHRGGRMPQRSHQRQRNVVRRVFGRVLLLHVADRRQALLMLASARIARIAQCALHASHALTQAFEHCAADGWRCVPVRSSCARRRGRAARAPPITLHAAAIAYTAAQRSPCTHEHFAQSVLSGSRP